MLGVCGRPSARCVGNPVDSLAIRGFDSIPAPDIHDVGIFFPVLYGVHLCHTPSIAFRHLPPNSARFSYASEGALFIPAQLSSDAVSALRKVRVLIKLQALVYDILPSTTAVLSYAIGSRKLSTNEQFWVGAQTEISLLQTTQIISDVCFITDHVAYASSNKAKIV